MNETVSVDDAIKQGRKMIFIPSYVCFIVPVFAIAVVANEPFFEPWIAGALMIFGLAMALLYWSSARTRWKIWAYSNVRNVHELKKRAIKAKLIWPDTSWLTKTEIKLFEQSQKLRALQRKFNTQDEFRSDISIRPETRIYFSKPIKSIALVLFSALLIGSLIWMDDYLVIGTVAVFSGYFLFRTIRDLLDKKPQLVLSESGIMLKDRNFHDWAAISDEEVQVKNSGKSAMPYLVFKTKDGSKFSQRIGELSQSPGEIEKLLYEYRGRFERREKNAYTNYRL